MLETVGDTAASIFFFSDDEASENHIGMDGAAHDSTYFITCTGSCAGPHLPTVVEKTPAPKPNQWFNLTLSRTANVLTVSVNGQKAFTPPMSFAVHGIAIRPWRSTIHARSVRVCAAKFPPAPPPPPPPLPTVTVFKPGEAGVPVYRIPALCGAGPALVAFIEARLGGDFSLKKIMTKRSIDVCLITPVRATVLLLANSLWWLQRAGW